MNIEKLLKSMENIENKLPKDVDDKLNEPAKIIAKKEGTKFQVEVQGNSFNLLIMLARLETQLLQEIGCDEKEFETFKLIARMIAED